MNLLCKTVVTCHNIPVRCERRKERKGKTTLQLNSCSEAARFPEESLDFGLFTSFPRPYQLLVQCVPVFWVTLLAMPPRRTDAVAFVAFHWDPLGK